jgi:hypothetical protein
MNWTGVRSTRTAARAAVAIAVLVATACLGAGAASAVPVSGPAFGPFGLTPAPDADGTPRPYFNFTIAPGSQATDAVVATNLSSSDEQLRLTVSKGVTAANSGSAYENLTGPCTGPSCWISDLQSTITLAPGQQLALGFLVKVPRGIRPGQYLTGITLEPATPPTPVTVGGNGQSSAQAIVVDEVTVGVAVTIGDAGQLTTAVHVGRVTSEWIGSTPRLNIPVSNRGQTFAHGTGEISCRSGGRSLSYPFIMETVLPGEGAVLPVNAPGLQTGSLPCHVLFQPAAGGQVRWSGLVTLDSSTLTKTYHPAKGVYVSVPQQTMPVWALILIILGGLILLSLTAVLVQRRRLARRWR